MASVRTNWNRRKTGINHHPGTDIQLPGKPSEMPLKDAYQAIGRKMMEDDEIMDASERIEGFPFDILVSFSLALDKRFGLSSPCTVVKDGMMGPQTVAPDMVSVNVGVGETIQVPSGHFKLPGIAGYVAIYPDFRDCSCVISTMDMKRKDTHVVVEIAADVRELLKTHSIYKGKAVHLHNNNRGELDISKPPTFLDTTNVDREQLIFSDDLQKEIDDYLVTLIEDTERCVRDKIPLKRGYLLEGPYGVGKTLLARYLSKLCSDNGWTYLLIDDAKALKDTLQLAQRYEPALVFCEDIDRFASERTDAANDLLNTIDGVVSKDSQVVTCLTTNHIEKIQADNQAILRPGRFDVVFSITPPNAEAVERLIRFYAGPLLAADESVKAPADVLAGQIPAIIREAVERSKLSRIRRGDDMLNSADIMTAATSMDKHIQLLATNGNEPTDAEVLEGALARTATKEVGKLVEQQGEQLFEKIREGYNNGF